MIQLNSILRYPFKVSGSINKYVKVIYQENLTSESLIIGGFIVDKADTYTDIKVESVDDLYKFGLGSPFKVVKKKTVRKII